MAWIDGRRAAVPTNFGGEPQPPDDSVAGQRANGARERAAGRAALFQTAGTTSVVGATLVGLYAASQTLVTEWVALLGLVLSIGFPAYRAFLWYLDDKCTEARTESYVITLHSNWMTQDDVRREMSKTRPDLVRWLPKRRG
jgi:hypothetical protein